MFLGLRAVIHEVQDLEAAGQWYETVFEAVPVVREPSKIGFEVGHDRLWLIPSGQGEKCRKSGAVAYWAVSDIEREVKRIAGLGAEMDGALQHLGDEIHFATFRDPFGNTFGIGGLKPDPEKNRIDDKDSATALWTTLMRAFSFAGEAEDLGCMDSMAHIFLTEDQKAALADKENRASQMETLFVIGVYEYVTARTRIFDQFYTRALAQGAEQIVLLGAGYDSRPYRLGAGSGKVKVFEVDAPMTQERKQDCLARAGVEIPEQVSFVPMNFNRDDLAAELSRAGFDRTKKTYFAWEGVTFYLTPEAVAATLDAVRTHSAPGSSVAFDFIELWPGIFEAYGVKELIAFNRKNQSGESGNAFALEQGKAGSFLSEKGFEILEFFGTKEIEEQIRTADGRFLGHVTGSFRIVRAVTGA